MVSVVTFWREMSSTMPLCSATSALHRASSLRQRRGVSLRRGACEAKRRAPHQIAEVGRLDGLGVGTERREHGAAAQEPGLRRRHLRAHTAGGHTGAHHGQAQASLPEPDSEKRTHLLLLARHGGKRSATENGREVGVPKETTMSAENG